MTPSEWHAQEDAGHDEMQLAVLLFWKKKIENGSPVTRVEDGFERTFLPYWAGVEFPIISRRNGVILAFADVAVRFSGAISEYWGFFELKPSVKSVGALLRQCHAIDAAVWRSELTREDRSLNTTRFQVTPVVYENDPKIGLIKRFGYDCVAFPRGGEA